MFRIYSTSSKSDAFSRILHTVHRDVKRAQKRGKDMGKLKALLALLVEEQLLRLGTKIIRYETIGRAIETLISNPIGL